MQYIDGQYLYSATDLVGYLECVHLTGLDFLALGNEGLRVQRTGKDESTALIARKGTEHELAYLQRLRDKGLQVVDIAEGGGSIDDKVQRTQAAMASRTQVIFQATLRQGPLYGHADFLMRVEGRASQFGDWSYEVADTKLARSPKAKFLIQLAFYSHLLTTAQGMAPHQMHVYLGDGKDRALRFADYEHYFNMALARFMADMAQRVAGSGAPSYPEPCAQCAMCHWRLRCDQQRLDDDHLSQVANITRQQREKLSAQGITTMAQLAALPADKPVRKMHTDTLARLREQAGLQDSAKRDGQRRAVVLPLDPERRRGFFLLPQPNEGDMFFDMEGDPLQEGGL
jgi:predicted RecB family nuclease